MNKKIKNIVIKVTIFFFLSILPPAETLKSSVGMVEQEMPVDSTTTLTPNFYSNFADYPSIIYENITYYPKELYNSISSMLAEMLYQQSKPETVEQANVISREQALEEIKTLTARLFDLNDEEQLSVLLDLMHEMTKSLHEQEDIKTINAIKFLLENQYKLSVLDLPRWYSNEKNLYESIPTTEKVALMSNPDKRAVLMNKAFKNKKIKDEEKRAQKAEKKKEKSQELITV